MAYDWSGERLRRVQRLKAALLAVLTLVALALFAFESGRL